jgi:hypothetical protein
MKNSAMKNALKSKPLGGRPHSLRAFVASLMNQGFCGYLASESRVV